MWAEIRYSARSFARAPGLTAALLATLAIGVGSNAAVFGFIRGLSVAHERPADVRERVVTVFDRDAQYGYRPLSLDHFAAIQTRTAEFEWVGAVRESHVSIAIDGRMMTVAAASVTAEIAQWLELDVQGGVVVSDRLAPSERDSATAPALTVNGAASPIAHAAPDWLDGLFIGREIDLWLPLNPADVQGTSRTGRSVWVVGRLRDGVSAARAESALEPLGLEGELAVIPYTGASPDAASGLAQLTRLLPGAAALVFFIACANVVAFLLSRAAARSKETSMRIALGAGRKQLLIALLADGALLAFAGTALGLIVAMWTMDIVPAMLIDQDAQALRFAPDWRLLAGAALASALIVGACSLVPLLESRLDQPAAVLRRESSGPSATIRTLRRVLVVAQMAACSVLAISTGMLFDGFRAALRTTEGQTTNAIVAQLEWGPGFSGIDRAMAYFRSAEAAAMQVPAVGASAWALTLPGGRPKWQTMRAEPPGLKTRGLALDVIAFSGEMLDDVRLPPIAGRFFGGRDGPGSCRVGVLNDIAAGQLFAGDPVGRRVFDPSGEWVEIVGVVKAARAESVAAARPAIYYYREQTEPQFGRDGPATFHVPIVPASGESATLDVNVVSPGYFDAFGFEARAGAIWPSAPSPDACRAVLINSEAAERYFPQGALGGALLDEAGRRYEISGVVHAPQLRTAQRAVEPAVYLPASQNFEPRIGLVLTSRDDSPATINAVRQAVGSDKVLTLDEYMAKTTLATERIATLLFAAAAIMALTLAVLGVYGAMADAVHRRGREFALRIALGAPRRRVLGQVMNEAARLAAAGAVAGGIASIAAAYWLAQITPAAGGLQVTTALIGPALLAIVVLVACVLPARRALSADPLSIMREN